jgi:hypothetical protein
MQAKMEFHTEWAIPEDFENPEASPEEEPRAKSAAVSAGETQPAREKWLVVEA